MRGRRMTDNSRTNNKEEADMITVNLYYHPMNKELLMEDCMCEPYSNRGPEEHNMRIEMGKKLQD